MGLTGVVEEGLTEAVTQDNAFAAAAALWVSLHSANPGGTGAHEITSGTGASGRQLVTFSTSPGGGQNTNNVPVAFTVAGGETAYWYGLWDSQTGGSFLGGFPLVGVPKLAVISSIEDDIAVECPNHGLSVGQVLRFFPQPDIPTSVVPAGYNADTQYTVTDVFDADTFEVNGGVVAVASGAFRLAVDFSFAFSETGQYVVPLGNLTYETAS